MALHTLASCKRGAAFSLALACAVVLSACAGEQFEEDANGNPPASGATPAPGATPALAPGASAPPATTLPSLPTGSAELPLRRLIKTQFVNVMQEVARQALPSQGNAVATAIASAATNYPADSMVNIQGERHGGFYRLDQSVQQNHVDAAYEVASKMAAELTTSARLGSLMGGCATDTDAGNDDACLRNLIKKVGRLAWRRPLTDAEVTFHRNLAGNSPVNAANVSDALTLLLAAPQTLYFVEHGQAGNGSGRVNLTAHELAARLSFQFWQTIPDAELAGHADSGKLLEPATYETQVKRLAADARAEPAVREFFTQWFRTHEMEPLDSRLGDPVFDAFRGNYTPNKDTRNNAINEVAELTSFHYKNGGSLKSMFNDKRSFARTGDIAALYGVPAWDGASAPPDVSTGNRTGLLTRVAFLASGSANTRPILKGYRVRSALLCQSLPPPPADAVGVTVDVSDSITTRQVVEAKTGAVGTSCVGCHAMMNPLGFVTENFDALGRPRNVQNLFNAQGQVVASPPIKTDVIPKITPADARTAADSLQASQYLLESGEFERCFAQHYYRYTFGRREVESDRAALTDLMNAARSGASIRDLMVRLALRDEFKTKAF
jgi:hypothetical protein